VWIIGDRLINIALFVQGTLLGMGLFLIGLLGYLYIFFFRALQPNEAIDVRRIKAMTIRQPLYWIAFLVALAIGLAVVRHWQLWQRS
jgi:hypothetical protein